MRFELGLNWVIIGVVLILGVYFFILIIITEHGATRMAFGVEWHNINININISLLKPTGHVMQQQV
jgi:hypothetical protein